MEARLPAVLQSAAAHDIKLQWVIIMGGINDLTAHGDPKHILEALRALYAASHAAGARVLALTCLPTRYGTKFPVHDVPRQQLNDMIRNETANSSFVRLLDAAKLFTYPLDAKAEPAAAALWSDHVHLSPAGYDILGRHIFDALRDSLKAEQ